MRTLPLLAALLAFGLCAHAHGGEDHGSADTMAEQMGGMHMGATGASGGEGEMDMGGGGGMSMGGAGSGNMSALCYTDPSDPDCAGFERSDDDWASDIDKLCDAMPFMIGCSLYEQCMSGTASGEYCELSSLTANLCVDMPKMKGCEAWLALCSANNTVVEQCLSPGPVPNVLTTFVAKDAIEALCGYHCMSGCGKCQAGTSWATCTDPLLVLARQCYEMPGMAECGPQPDGAGLSTMCTDAAVAAAFPQVCTNPPDPADPCN